MLCYRLEDANSDVGLWQSTTVTDSGPAPGAEDQNAQQAEISKLQQQVNQLQNQLAQKKPEACTSPRRSSIPSSLKHGQDIASVLDHLSNAHASLPQAKADGLVTKVRGMLDSIAGTITSPLAPADASDDQPALHRKPSLGNALKSIGQFAGHMRERSQPSTPHKDAKQQKPNSPSSRVDTAKSPGTREQLKGVIQKVRDASGDWPSKFQSQDQHGQASTHSKQSAAGSGRPTPNTSTMAPPSSIVRTGSNRSNVTSINETPSKPPKLSEAPSSAPPASLKKRPASSTPSLHSKKSRPETLADPATFYGSSTSPLGFRDPSTTAGPPKGSSST